MATNITDLSNVQGDILLKGLTKEVETFWFFTIVDSTEFGHALRRVANHDISHTQHVLDTRRHIKHFKAQRGHSHTEKLPTVGANISFSFSGLQKIAAVTGLQVSTGDTIFETGMKAAAVSDLHDPVKADDPQTPDWEADWLDHQIDGVLLVAGNCKDIVHKKLHHIISQFGSSVQRALKIDGNVRPGTQKGKEHFGYQDGISQPIVGDLPNLTKEEMFVPPGQDIIPQGVILCGRPGDAKATSRPSWMLDGSFLCFRKLQQDVSAWENFVVQSSSELGISPDLLGARLVGRWKSGCPINLQPDFDNTEIARDVLRNNFFEFDPTGLNSAQEFTITSGQPSVNCPLGAHIRKTNPRGDQPPDGRASVNIHRILRRGIPYGPEMDEDPAAERGLLFACYQSDLSQGFELIQKRWANDPSFRFPNSGLDALIGQTNSEPTVGMKGLVPDDANRELHVSGINRFVIPKGGEYFFSPSLSALRGELSDVKG